LHPYIVLGVDAATVIAVTRLIAYAIDDSDRWRRFLVLTFLLLAVAAVWWVIADGGVNVILHEFGRASITRPASAWLQPLDVERELASGQRRTATIGYVSTR
jgi:hypothetical protein